jgi:hypothetical protein
MSVITIWRARRMCSFKWMLRPASFGRLPCAMWTVLLLLTVWPRYAVPQSLSPEELLQEVYAGDICDYEGPAYGTSYGGTYNSW